MAEIRGEDGLKSAYAALHGMREQWRKIGSQLNVEESDLDDIQRSSGTQERLMQVLILWLRNNPRASWCDIVEALRSRSVNKLNLAEDVRMEHCRWYNPQPMSINPNVPLTPIVVAPPQPVPDSEGEKCSANIITSVKCRALRGERERT